MQLGSDVHGRDRRGAGRRRAPGLPGAGRRSRDGAGPPVLAFVLGTLLEGSLRRSLLIFEGDPLQFLTRPISGTLLVVFVLVTVGPLLCTALSRRNPAGHRSDTEELV